MARHDKLKRDVRIVLILAAYEKSRDHVSLDTCLMRYSAVVKRV